MIKFKKPANLNGKELLAELNLGQVKISKLPFDDAEGNIWLEINETDELKAAEIVAAHNGTTVAPEPSIEQKLASVGLSVTDLKQALGL